MKTKTTKPNDFEIAHEEYLAICSRIATIFAFKYFGKKYYTSEQARWIDKTFAINDYYFDVESMITFMRLKYSRDLMFEYKDYEMECHTSGKSQPATIDQYKRSVDMRKDLKKRKPIGKVDKVSIKNGKLNINYTLNTLGKKTIKKIEEKGEKIRSVSIGYRILKQKGGVINKAKLLEVSIAKTKTKKPCKKNTKLK